MPRYRYITKAASPDGRLSDYHLYPASMLSSRDDMSLRVTIPEGIVIDKGWHRTKSDLAIKDLDPVPVIRVNWKARQMPCLWPHPMREWKAILQEKGYIHSRRMSGWMGPRTAEEFPYKQKG